MVCSNCGQELNEGVKFCTKCGTKCNAGLAGENKLLSYLPLFFSFVGIVGLMNLS
jgi:uncharacterized membrane protein YvbJ